MEMKSASNNKNTKRLFRKLNKREKTVAIVLMAALLVGLWLPERVTVAISPSLDHRVFFLSPVNTKKIKTGDYLVFKHHDTTFVHKGLNEDNDRLIKKVGCSPGQILTRNEEREFSCSAVSQGKETFLGKALEKDNEGRSLPQFSFQGFVPDDSFFMVGSNPRSFDSKYFGFVQADDILYKALPLW